MREEGAAPMYFRPANGINDSLAMARQGNYFQ